MPHFLSGSKTEDAGSHLGNQEECAGSRQKGGTSGRFWVDAVAPLIRLAQILLTALGGGDKEGWLIGEPHPNVSSPGARPLVVSQDGPTGKPPASELPLKPPEVASLCLCI